MSTNFGTILNMINLLNATLESATKLNMKADEIMQAVNSFYGSTLIEFDLAKDSLEFKQEEYLESKLLTLENTIKEIYKHIA